MFFQFIKNIGLVQEVNKLTMQLSDYGLFAALLDLAALKSIERSTLKNNNNAERAAWHDGYVEALRDVFNFSELASLRNAETTSAPVMDYGALQKLLDNKEITLDEFNILKQSRNHS